MYIRDTYPLRQLDPLAALLNLAAAGWSCEHNRRGFVTDEAVAELLQLLGHDAPGDPVAILVERGIWARRGEGFDLFDFGEYFMCEGEK